MSYVKIGVGGPVGSGKTALIERLTREMSKEYSICVVTNDIYTKALSENFLPCKLTKRYKLHAVCDYGGAYGIAVYRKPL